MVQEAEYGQDDYKVVLKVLHVFRINPYDKSNGQSIKKIVKYEHLEYLDDVYDVLVYVGPVLVNTYIVYDGVLSEE